MLEVQQLSSNSHQNFPTAFELASLPGSPWNGVNLTYPAFPVINDSSLISTDIGDMDETTSDDIDDRIFPAVVTAFALSVLCIVTAVGNLLVIISIIIVRRLRTPPNTIILSLAISDLNVAILVMPVAIIYEIEVS